jgi:hypothetical protein
MPDRARRRELLDEYRSRRPEAAVYAIRNTVDGRALLDITVNLPALRNRIDFARATGSIAALDGRLANDIRTLGLDVFELEVLEVVTPEPGSTDDELREELATLAALWREKLGREALY